MAANDSFPSYKDITAPADHAAAVTPHNTTELAEVSRSLYVGTTGDVSVVTAGGETVTFVGVPAGTFMPVRARIVRSTGTEADDIVALW